MITTVISYTKSRGDDVIYDNIRELANHCLYEYDDDLNNIWGQIAEALEKRFVYDCVIRSEPIRNLIEYMKPF